MEAQHLRKCGNIKSRKHPEAQCPNTATHGDFCSRHFKNPFRFQSPKEQIPSHPFTRSEKQALLRIQKAWRRFVPLIRFRHQGPAANCLELSKNTMEVYSLDPLNTIPSVFFFSFADETKSIWSFDIRSLSHLVSEGSDLVNPYTRQPLSSTILQLIHSRIVWLRERKYPILHVTAEGLTQEQLWNQKVLDVFFKLEALGYRASCRWFDEMNSEHHERFYRRLYRLWTYQLGLTSQEKEAIVPGYSTPSTKLFRQHPDKLVIANHELKWWRRNNLNVILEFLTKAPNKSQQTLGALYVLMGLVQVVPEAAEAYPWILESI
jgi:hypothetical protein